jgi:hypothetical protein
MYRRKKWQEARTAEGRYSRKLWDLTPFCRPEIQSLFAVSHNCWNTLSMGTSTTRVPLRKSVISRIPASKNAKRDVRLRLRPNKVEMNRAYGPSSLVLCEPDALLQYPGSSAMRRETSHNLSPTIPLFDDSMVPLHNVIQVVWSENGICTSLRWFHQGG